MAMAPQSNFHLKAILDHFRRVMPPKGTTMALHNSRTRLSSVLQPLFLQQPHTSLSTLTVFQRTPKEAEGVENMFSSSSETNRPEAGEAKKMAPNRQAKQNSSSAS